MRLGVVLEAGDGGLAGLARQAAAVEDAGLALGWLACDDDAALLAVAAVGVSTVSLRLAACVRLGAHPLEIAEAAAVADNCTNGRVVLVLEADEETAELLGETADAVLAALAPRPFRHAGARWTIPGNLPGNEDPEERIALRPPAVQTELPVWLHGPGAPEAARARGLAHVGEEGRAPDAAARLRRPALLDLAAGPDGAFDADALVARLRTQRAAWGLDTAVLRLPAALDDGARERAIARLATHVAPRVALHELPAGVEAHWRAALP